MRHWTRWVIAASALALIVAACGGGDDDSTSDTKAADTAATTAAPAATTAAPTATTEAEGPVRTVTAPAADITVDADPADWADVPDLDVTLDPIEEVSGVPTQDAIIQAAHDDTNFYLLVTVPDDYNFGGVENPHLTSAFAALFPVAETPGPHMGATDEMGDETGGTVDIWHWEMECEPGEPMGGAANESAADADGGDDSVCNFDDEWATNADNREDDNTDTGENSLYGVWGHSNDVEDGEGNWYFEISRPLQTGDEQDVQFTVGESTQLAIAYWDSDNGTPADGWEDDQHTQTASQGWIEVDLV